MPLGKISNIYGIFIKGASGSTVDTPPSVRSVSSASREKPSQSNGRDSVSEESITSIDAPNGPKVHEVRPMPHKEEVYQ